MIFEATYTFKKCIYQTYKIYTHKLESIDLEIDILNCILLLD